MSFASEGTGGLGGRHHSLGGKAYRLIMKYRFTRRIGAGVLGNIQIVRNRISDRRFLAKKLPRNTIGEGTTIHPSAFIAEGGVSIGRGCAIGPDCVIFENTVLEDCVEIGCGTVVGCQGYIYRKHGKRITHVRHTGGVRICRGARIRSLCCIDRSVSPKKGTTLIDEDSDLGDHIHVAHNAKIGKRCRILSGAQIAGYAVIGDESVIGCASSISNRVVIGEKVFVMDGAVVTKNIAPGRSVGGSKRDARKDAAQKGAASPGGGSA